MKFRIKELFFIFAALASLAFGQVAQKYNGATGARTEPSALTIPIGQSDTYAAGSTLTVNGTLSGTPTGGTLNLSNTTLTLPAATSALFQPLDSDLTSIADLTTQPFGRSLLEQANKANARATLGAAPANPALGLIFSQASWANLSGYTANGATPTIVSNALEFTGGSGSFTATFDRDYTTGLHEWSQTCDIVAGTPTSTSYGIGIGIRGTHSNSGGRYSFVGRIAMYSGGDQGKLLLNSGNAGTLVGTSSTAVTFSAGDTLRLTVWRSGDSVGVSCRNLTTQSVPVTLSYTFSFAYGATSYTPNTGKPAIFNFGGTHKVIAWSMRSYEKKFADLCFIGDSKTAGYSMGSSAWAQRLEDVFNAISVAAGYEKTNLILSRLPEVLALAPANVVLCVGRNDILDGASPATIQANYASIVTQLEAAGTLVWHLLPLYETALDQSALKSWINSTYSSTGRVIDSYSETLGSNAIVADGVHPSPAAGDLVFEAVRQALSEGGVPIKAQ